MILNTTEKFYILIQHPVKPRFILSEQSKNAGCIGSMLLGLAHNKSLEIENGKLIVKSTNIDLSQAHQSMLEQIEKSSRNRRIKTWIARLSRKCRKYQKVILSGLEKKGIIKIINKRFIGIKYYRTLLTDTITRDHIINEIRDILFKDAKINHENSLILGLIHACKMHKIICKDKHEHKICKRKLQEIMKSDLISQGVDKVLKEMHAAIIGAIVASTVAASVSSQ